MGRTPKCRRAVLQWKLLHFPQNSTPPPWRLSARLLWLILFIGLCGEQPWSSLPFPLCLCQSSHCWRASVLLCFLPFCFGTYSLSLNCNHPFTCYEMFFSNNIRSCIHKPSPTWPMKCEMSKDDTNGLPTWTENTPCLHPVQSTIGNEK